MYRVVIILLMWALLLFAPPIINDHYNPIAHAQNATITPTQMQKLKSMDMLMGEHALVGGEMLIARYSQRSDFQAARNAVSANTSSLSLMIDDFYGDRESSQFTTIWNRHIDSFMRYADAKRAKDENRQTQAMRELQQFTQDISNLLSRGNTDMFRLSQNYFSQHILDEKKILDEYADRDYEAMYKAMHEAYEHATSMTDKLQ